MLNLAVGLLLLNMALSWHVYKHLYSQCRDVDGPGTHFTDKETEALGDELMCPKVSQLVSGGAACGQAGGPQNPCSSHCLSHSPAFQEASL